MLGTGAGVVGALVGLAVGVALSVYVAILDVRKRSEGLRSRAQYRGSLVVVPGILAGLGALVGIGIARLG
jgi:hypothetical protein